MVRGNDPRTAAHPAARAEFAEALHWYRERDANVALNFRHAIEHAVAMIEAMPHSWPRHLHGTQRHVLSSFPFSIIYRHRAGTIQILAIAHAKRRPGYWRKRV